MLHRRTLVVCVVCLALVVTGLIIWRNKQGDHPQVTVGRSPALTGRSQVLAGRAENVFASFAQSDYKNATKDFNDYWKKQMPADRLQTAWSDFEAKAGPLKSYKVLRVTGNSVCIACTFEKGPMWAVVEFDNANRITKFTMSERPM